MFSIEFHGKLFFDVYKHDTQLILPLLHVFYPYYTPNVIFLYTKALLEEMYDYKKTKAIFKT